jgi:hypothetical protein
MIVKSGTVLTLEHGEYSDFAYEGPFVVLRDFDQRGVCEEFTKTYTDDELRWMSADVFTAWLSRNGYIVDPTISLRWCLGWYGFNPEIAGE